MKRLKALIGLLGAGFLLFSCTDSSLLTVFESSESSESNSEIISSPEESSSKSSETSSEEISSPEPSSTSSDVSYLPWI